MELKNKIFHKVLKSTGSIHYHLFGIRIFSRKPNIHNFSMLNTNKTNFIHIITENGSVVEKPKKIPGLSFNITGNNNHITIYEPFHFDDLNIHIAGDIDITINKNCNLSGKCLISKPRNFGHSKLVIGNNFSSGYTTFDMCDFGDIVIGDNNMWAGDIYVKTDDTHTVFDNTTRTALNKSTQINIGNNVWCGMRAFICKNSVIPDYCIIGACSVVAGKFNETNCVIVGNPAKIHKGNINWCHTPVNLYTKTAIKDDNK